MSQWYLVLLGDVVPHVGTAMLYREAPIYGAEQGQMQVCANMIVDRWVVFHHVVTE